MPKPRLLLNEITYATTIGKRQYQEDRIAIESPIDLDGINEHLHFFGVLDGHGGSKCVDYCKQHIIVFTKEEIKKQRSLQLKEDIPMILQTVIARLVKGWDDISLSDKSHEIVDDDSKSRFFKTLDMETYCDSGTTLCCLIVSNTGSIYIANLGDSRCVIDIPSHILMSTRDHSVPTKLSHALQILPFKVIIKDNRLQNDLAMTHSIGDNTEQLVGVVCRTPDISTVQIPTKAMNVNIILATDGLFDNLDMTTMFLDEHDNAQNYIDTIVGGGDDNISLIYIKCGFG